MALNKSITTLSGTSASRPIGTSMPQTGLLYYATDSNAASIYDGSTWKAFDGTLKDAGGHMSTSTTYVSNVGTAGTANTAMTILDRVLPANVMTQLGDRMRIRTYFFANSVAPIVVSTTVGPFATGTTISDTTHAGAGASGLCEAWVHYISGVSANIIEQEVGALGARTAINVGGFSWGSTQSVRVNQDAVSGNYATVYGVFVDVFPKGII